MIVYYYRRDKVIVNIQAIALTVALVFAVEMRTLDVETMGSLGVEAELSCERYGVMLASFLPALA